MRELVANRYAKALVQLGKEDAQCEQYGEQLKAFEAVLESSSDLRAVMENPVYNREQKKDIFKAIQDKLELSPVVSNFILLLIDNRRLGYFSEIVRCYEKLADEVAGRIRARVLSALPLPASSLDEIQKRIADLTGKQVFISAEEDPELIGGVITRIGDTVYDGSLRTQLKNMIETLTKG